MNCSTASFASAGDRATTRVGPYNIAAVGATLVVALMPPYCMAAGLVPATSHVNYKIVISARVLHRHPPHDTNGVLWGRRGFRCVSRSLS